MTPPSSFMGFFTHPTNVIYILMPTGVDTATPLVTQAKANHGMNKTPALNSSVRQKSGIYENGTGPAFLPPRPKQQSAREVVIACDTTIGKTTNTSNPALCCTRRQAGSSYTIAPPHATAVVSIPCNTLRVHQAPSAARMKKNTNRQPPHPSRWGKKRGQVAQNTGRSVGRQLRPHHRTATDAYTTPHYALVTKNTPKVMAMERTQQLLCPNTRQTSRHDVGTERPTYAW